MTVFERTCAFALASLLLLLSAAAASAELVVNGGFEANGGTGTSTFSNWTVVRENANPGAEGNFFAQTGTRSPTAKLTVMGAPGGSFTAMADQTGPGRTAIYQDISVPSTGQMWLSLRLFVLNQSDDFAGGASLDFNVVPNQHARVDVMNPAAALFDTGIGVLTTAYITQPGDAQLGSYFPVSINLKSFAGQTVRIRVSEVDNLHGLVVGVDQVSATYVPVNTCAPVRPREGGASCNLDIDGDGLLTVTDALLATRYLLGFRNAALGQGITFDACATNTSAAGLNAAAATLSIGAPPALDIDGDGAANAATDGALLMRAMLGITGTAATSGVVAPSPAASRSLWLDARRYLNNACLAGVL